MNYSLEEIFFALLRSEVCGTELSSDIKNQITSEKLSALYKMSKSHDLAHILCEALNKNGFLIEESKEELQFLKERNMAIYRYEQMKYDYEKIVQTLEEEKIPYIPLKGAFLRQYYIEPWHRTSCDIDILVKQDDLKKAVKVLERNTDFRVRGKKNYHDISLFSTMGVHLELHYSICEDLPNLDKKLSEVWTYAHRKNNLQHCYVLSNEFFMFHILAHMCYHFIRGGCGVRTVLDVWILNQRMPYVKQELEMLCEETGTLTFYRQVCKLSSVWFEGEKNDGLTEEMSKYILSAGIYGTKENRVAVNSVKAQGRFKYVISYIFPPYSILKKQYPILKKWKILYPFCIVYRWFARLFQGHAKCAFKNVKATVKQSDSRIEEVRGMLDKLELRNLLKDKTVS